MSPRPTAPNLDPRIWRSRRNRKLAAFLCLPGLTLGTLTLVGANAAGLFDTRAPRVCAASAHVLPSAGAVTVRIYNASGVTGLAGRTAAQLTSKGFRVAAVGNSPEARWFTGAPRVIHGIRGTDQAALVASKMPGAVQASDDRGDSSVDVVLGAGWTAKGSTAAPAVGVASPQQTGAAAATCD